MFLAALVFFLAPQGHAASEKETLPVAEAVTHYLMGLIHDWNGETDQAIAEYLKASEFDRSSFAIHLKLGAGYARAGKTKEAVDELHLASSLNPEDLQAHYVLALIYSADQNFDKASEEYEIILKHFSKNDPKNAEIHSYLGQLYYSQKKYEKAIEQFDYILTLEPKNADILFMLGSIHLDLHDRIRAMEYFKKTVDIDPDHESGLNSLAYMYAEDGIHLDDALQYIKRTLELDPDNGAYLDTKGWIYFKKGMYAEALDPLLKASQLIKDPLICEHLGDVYQKLNKSVDAEKYWKQSLSLKPEQTAVLEKINSLKKGRETAR